MTPFHYSAVFRRRVKKLSDHLILLLPRDIPLNGLDVGCGSGEVAKSIEDRCPHIRISGVDVLIRKGTMIKVIKFDGTRLPYEDKSYDFTMLVDVLHHAHDPGILIRECVRVSRKFILLKDHVCESGWDRARLRFMDWVGNRGYDVQLPYNYLSTSDWEKLYRAAGIDCKEKISKLDIYPQPFSLLFDSTLHFVAKLAALEAK
ncbi:MAG: methyltransferase domain-containing protein [Planctomycetota bacterium]|nr:methyltransferase domain-containing protein [Planctomycetota bacterium]